MVCLTELLSICGAHCGLEPLRTKAGFGSIPGWNAHAKSSKRDGNGGSQFEKRSLWNDSKPVPAPSSI